MDAVLLSVLPRPIRSVDGVPDMATTAESDHILSLAPTVPICKNLSQRKEAHGSAELTGYM